MRFTIEAGQVYAALFGEAGASGVDPLRLTHLFGSSDPAAIRYCAELGGITTRGAGGVSLSPACQYGPDPAPS